MTIVSDYLSLTEKWKKEYGDKTIVLMQVGSFFEVYALIDENGNYIGSEIERFSEINDMTISKKNVCVGKSKVVMAGFGLPQLEKYVKKLQENGYTIPVYTQDTPSKNTTRSLSHIFSPGTFFSNDTQELSNNVTCVWIHYSAKNLITKNDQITVGISNVDNYTGKTSIFEFNNIYNHNPCTYDELERYIAIYKPAECIIISNLENHIIDDIINFANINCNKIHKVLMNDSNNMSINAKNSEKQTYQSEIIKRFYPNSNDEIFLENLHEYCIATQSFVFLLDFIYQHNPNLVNNLSDPIYENYSDRLTLANHSLKQLNIIPDERYSGKLSCVTSFLNNCITTMGKRKFTYDLLNPTCNVDELRISYDIVDHVMKKNSWESIRTELQDIRDLEKLKRKLILKKITPKDFNILYYNLSTINKLFKKNKKDKVLLTYIEKYVDTNISDDCKIINDFIDSNMDIDKCKFIDDMSTEKLGNNSVENLDFIKKGVNENIDKKFKENMDSVEQFESIRKFCSDLVKKYEKSTKNTEYVKIHETAKTESTLMGTKRRITFLKKEVENLIAKEGNMYNIQYMSKFSNKMENITINLEDFDYKLHGSSTTAMIVTSPQIRKISLSVQNSKDQLIQEIIKYYQDYIYKFLDYQTQITNIITFTTLVDTLQCKCYLATKYNYKKPKIIESEQSYFKAKNIRHCLIEQLNTRELYVANDVELGNDYNGILLYGTNAVGKTSLIKAIGISIIMAQSGLYVPCDNLEYSPYNCLFTRILGNDNIFKGLSTFAVEMSELRNILKMANKNSLILGDELCSGTESDSALSIFVSGLENLHKINCSFIFATHFHEIVNYDEVIDMKKLKMCHMSVIYDKEKNKLVYDRKLKDGPGDSMYGLEVCKALNLPQDFLDRAHELRMKYNTKQKNVLSMKKSQYNSKKVKNLCEICKVNMGSEVHHLQHQKNSKNNYIKSFHKNHLANLVNICETCHDNFHKTNEEHKIVKTSEGYEIMKI